MGKSYEKQVDLEAYLKPYQELARDLFRKITPTGSLCWQVGNFVEAGEIYPLDIFYYFYYRIFKEAGFHLRNRIIWHFEHGLHATRRLSGRYETLLWFTKDDSYVFNLDSIRVPSKYPGKLHYKGPKKGLPSGNPLGKNPSDFWTTVLQDWENEIWTTPNVKSNHPEKTIHPCQFPIELVQRCVLALTNQGDRVLDPFLGVGSTVIAAMMHERFGLGFETDDDYIQLARKRIREFQAGTLKVRPLGRAVHKPTGREKVSQVPLESLNNDVA